MEDNILILCSQLFLITNEDKYIEELFPNIEEKYRKIKFSELFFENYSFKYIGRRKNNTVFYRYNSDTRFVYCTDDIDLMQVVFDIEQYCGV